MEKFEVGKTYVCECRIKPGEWIEDTATVIGRADKWVMLTGIRIDYFNGRHWIYIDGLDNERADTYEFSMCAAWEVPRET